MIFFKKRVDDRIDELDSRLSVSFSRVRYDTDVIFQWLNYFHEKTQEQDARILSQYEEIASLKHALEGLPRTREEIKKVIDEHYALQALLERIARIEEKLQKKEPGKASLIRASIAPIKEAATTALQDKVMRKVTRNSKEYIKSIILSFINKYEKISALQLRDMLVEEQGLCSKSSFYRILEELEKESAMRLLSKGKEKLYSSISVQR